MGGGLMQLVAYGAQDVYLSGNPQITFFKVVYRRHTNFSVEPIQQTWNGSADFGRTVTCNVNRNGDLITNMYVAVRLNAVAGVNPVEPKVIELTPEPAPENCAHVIAVVPSVPPAFEVHTQPVSACVVPVSTNT